MRSVSRYFRSAIAGSVVFGLAASHCTPLKIDVEAATDDGGGVNDLDSSVAQLGDSGRDASADSADSADSDRPDAAPLDASSDTSSHDAKDADADDGSTATVFSLTIAKPRNNVVHGGSVTIDVTLARAPGFSGTVDCTVSGLPSGLTADPLAFAAGVTSGALIVHAAQGAAIAKRFQLSLDGVSSTHKGSAPFNVLVQDAPGLPDVTFGSSANGVATLPIATWMDRIGSRGIGFQAGKIIVCGSVYSASQRFALGIARLSGNGVLDPTFGPSGDGTFVTHSPNNGDGNENCAALHVLADRRIILAGLGTPNGVHGFLAARLSENGAIDPTFGLNGSGFFTTSFGSDPGVVESKSYALAVQADGHILIGGYAPGGSALVRLDQDGRRDTFGPNGDGTVLALTSDKGVNGASNTTGLELNGDGTIAVSTTGGPGFEARRLSTSGAILPTYGVSGVASTPSGGQVGDLAGQMALQPDGKVVLSGTSPANGSNPAAIQLARFDADGKLDPTFGIGGIVTTTLPGGDASATNVAILPDGRIAVAIAAPGPRFGLARYTALGVLDTTFGGAGYVTPELGQDSAAQSVTSDDEGRILVGGVAADGDRLSGVIIRYWP